VRETHGVAGALLIIGAFSVERVAIRREDAHMHD
jgi:hypothetical protein